MSTCRSCRARILWAVTSTGKRLPVDPDPVEEGNVLLTGEAGDLRAVVLPVGQPTLDDDPRYVSHFATCPNADQHRKSR